MSEKRIIIKLPFTLKECFVYATEVTEMSRNKTALKDALKFFEEAIKHSTDMKIGIERNDQSLALLDLKTKRRFANLVDEKNRFFKIDFEKDGTKVFNLYVDPQTLERIQSLRKKLGIRSNGDTVAHVMSCYVEALNHSREQSNFVYVGQDSKLKTFQTMGMFMAKGQPLAIVQ